MVLAPTYPMLRDATLRTFLELAQRAEILADFNKAEMRAELVNGITVLFRSSDNPDRLRGPNIGWFWLDEAAMMKPDVWLIMLGRLRESPGRSWMTTTPRGRNWLYKTFVVQGGADFATIRAPSGTNQYLPAGFLRTLETQYGETFRAQEVGGEFVDDSEDARFQSEWLGAQRPRSSPLPESEWPQRLRHIDLSPYRLNRPGSHQRLNIWVPPAPHRIVVVGADVADEPGSSHANAYDAAVVMDVTTGQELASVRGKWEHDRYADLLCDLALAYGGTLIPERNNHGHAVLTAIKLRARKSAAMTAERDRWRWAIPRIGSHPGEKPPRWGWVTRGDNKPAMITLVARGLRDAFDGHGEHALTLHTPALIAELADYRRYPDGKMGPGEGGTADLVMALAVALGYIHLRPKAGKPSAGGPSPMLGWAGNN